MVSALSRVKTIKLQFWFRESVRNSVIAFARDLNFVRNQRVSVIAGCPQGES